MVFHSFIRYSFIPFIRLFLCKAQALSACQLTISGTISFPFRGAFHLSLTVLVHYRCVCVYSLGSWSTQIPTGPSCPLVLRNLLAQMQISRTRLSRSLVCYSEQFCYLYLITYCKPYNPPTCVRVQAVPLSLAATNGISIDFFSSPYLDVSVRMVSSMLLSRSYDRLYSTVSISRQRGCPIRKPPDRRSMAPPRRISLPYTSFLGTNTQGIHCQLVALQRTKVSFSVLNRNEFLCSFSNEKNYLLSRVSSRPPGENNQ